ncbi:chitin deacetylase 1-related [Anaeramoeba ignava]|uniref:Chitin deacetylase 1-related n=1 Tax=Anaeramoeba ignava TaxID=1746090 RepID=A0A9Q0LC20_ANAIG|nr:chitin deacetylase 1-related [Anaeramoeba ignava]
MRIIKRKYPQVLWFKETQEKVIALTIDDAPSEITPKILEILEENQIKITFFCIGDHIEKNQHIFDQIKQKGHEIGNHLQRDERSVSLDITEFEKQLINVDKQIFTNKIPPKKWIRPGGGHFTKEMIDITNKHGYKMCLGDVYPHDPQIQFSWINTLYVKLLTKSGSVIVLHDRKWTPKTLYDTIPYLKKKGFRFMTLSEFDSFQSY